MDGLLDKTSNPFGVVRTAKTSSVTRISVSNQSLIIFLLV